jgi:glycosyltransferase involved in cell wall biosynthesis
VVIPALNEALNLPAVLAWMPPIYELIVVDGHSSDGTPEVVRNLRPAARIVLQQGRGKGDALRTGFAAATGDVIVMLDADGSTDPREIPRFLEALIDGADFVKGSRFLPDGGSADITRLRRVGALLLTALVNLAFGTRYTDLCYGYNAFWRRCLQEIAVTCDGFEVETLLNIAAARANLTIAEVPSMEGMRLNGESHLRVVRDGLRVLRTIIRERLRRVSAIEEPQPAGAFGITLY